MQTVAVAVPRPVWQTYTYTLPPGMQGGVLEGCRVAVPLGKGRVIGTVWRENPGTVKGIKLRPVLQRLDSRPLLPETVMKLLRWAADYYMEPPGMMAAAAFPPGMQGNAVRLVEALQGSSLRHLSGGWPLEYSLLQSLAENPATLDAVLAHEAAEGRAASWWVPAKLPPPRSVTVVVPLAESAALVKTAQNIRKRAPRQAELLVCLAEAGRIPRSELLKRAGAGRGSLDRIREMGLLKEISVEVPRDPLQASMPLESKPRPEMNSRQKTAVETVLSMGSGTFLLHGVTGSGKTEVYLNLIEKALTQGKGAIVLVPEISLTPLAVSRFSQRFPEQVAVLHSGLSRGERLDTWNLVQQGRKRIVVGPRSAVFAPVENLGILVVDEEHDGSYKQGSIPRYSGRDLAVVRGSLENAPVLLGSASPSAESWKNALDGKYTLLSLPERASGGSLPPAVIVDSTTAPSGHSLLSDRLLAAIGRRTASGEQSIVLINRRGHSPVQMCFACGHVDKCPSCGISMTFHRKGNILKCHHCGQWKSASMRCPECGGEEFIRQGPGIQKVEEALKELLPRTRVIRMDRDTTRGKSSHWNIIEAFSRGEGDVLLGTQMVAKGHDFPGVTLAAVIGAEMGLCIPDFRACETTFDLLLQIAGRSGRAGSPGEVILQTMDSRNRVIELAAAHDYRTFIDEELAERKRLGFPPFSRAVRILWTGGDLRGVRESALASCTGINGGGVRLMGPSEAVMARIADRYRWSALLTASSRSSLRSAVERIRNSFSKSGVQGVRLETDVDPRNLL